MFFDYLKKVYPDCLSCYTALQFLRQRQIIVVPTIGGY